MRPTTVPAHARAIRSHVASSVRFVGVVCALTFGVTELPAQSAATPQAKAAQSPLTVKEESAGLLKQAKITSEAAMATARARVPGAMMQSAEIEREDGKLVYVFEMKIAGKTGIEEVSVNALTGAVVGVEHETPADEAKEAAADKAKAAKAKAAKGKGGTP